jgi:hypothetical protein
MPIMLTWAVIAIPMTITFTTLFFYFRNKKLKIKKDNIGIMYILLCKVAFATILSILGVTVSYAFGPVLIGDNGGLIGAGQVVATAGITNAIAGIVFGLGRGTIDTSNAF